MYKFNETIASMCVYNIKETPWKWHDVTWQMYLYETILYSPFMRDPLREYTGEEEKKRAHT